MSVFFAVAEVSYYNMNTRRAQQAVDFLMDDGLPTSPSGGAGFAGLMAARADQALGLGVESRALVILSEAPPDE